MQFTNRKITHLSHTNYNMATIINMPRLSDTMEEGTVASWLKQVGDKIQEGDILAEIETDKATMEFESFHDGTLLHIGVQAGETAPVDVLLAIIGEEGEDISMLLNVDVSEIDQQWSQFSYKIFMTELNWRDFKTYKQSNGVKSVIILPTILVEIYANIGG